MLREVRKKTIKETIIRNAIELFKQKGYESVTVEEIAFQSGIAKGTFFNYFQKKEHVLLHVAHSYMQLLGQIVQKHQEGTTKERLLRILHELLTIYMQYSDLLRLTLVETMKSVTQPTGESTNLSIFQETISTLIEQAKESGALRSHWDSNLIASVVVSLFIHTLITVNTSSNINQIIGNLQQQLDVVWEGIANA
jgi:AcrR family transcriptional regulator